MAEIHRVVMADILSYRELYVEMDNMFHFLCHMFQMVFPDVKGIGSCTDPRYTYCSGSSNTDWSKHEEDLLRLCNKFFDSNAVTATKATMDEVTISIVTELLTSKDPMNKGRKKYKGIGAMGAMQFIHMAALLGMIPLYCYSFGALMDDDLGPPKFIRSALNKTKKEFDIKECNSFFKAIHKDLQEIWGPMVTRGFLDNMLCELSRSYSKTVSALKLPPNTEEPSPDILLKPELMVDGDKNDICYYDGKKDRVQNFFLVSVTDALRPDLIMKKPEFWGESNSKANIALTNWSRNKADKKLLQWSEVGLQRNLESVLIMKPSLESYFEINDQE